jgi:hypothetical protein
MNVESKPDLKPRRKISLFAAWLIMVVTEFFAILIIVILIGGAPQNSFDGWFKLLFFILLISVVAATVVVWISASARGLSRRQYRKSVVFRCACFATLIAVFYTEEDWRGKHEWETFKRQWEAKGENFDRDSVVPRAVPDDENFAMSPVWITELKYNYPGAESWYGDRIYSETVSNNFRLMPLSVSTVTGTNWSDRLPTPDTLGNWAVARMTNLKLWQSFYRNFEEKNPSANIAITRKPQSPAQDVLLALSKYDPLIEQLRRDSKLPFSRFPIEYDRGNSENILVPQLAGLKQCAQVLQLRALAELQNGQADKALEDVKLILRLADAVRDEPLLISQLVRAAILQIALQPIYEGLANHEWPDPQLVELESELVRFNMLNDYKFAMRGEMIVCQDGLLGYVRRHPEEVLDVSDDAGSVATPPFVARVAVDLIPEGWFYQNELHADHCDEDFCLPVADTNRDIISPTTVRRADAAIAADMNYGSPNKVLEQLSGILLYPAMTIAYCQNAVNLARVAIALEHYRLAHSEYPGSLKALEPQFIARLPHDIINGQPLHYRRTANGQFVLYSVGWNETDDGGVVVFKEGSTAGVNREKGDWVWRYPKE